MRSRLVQRLYKVKIMASNSSKLSACGTNLSTNISADERQWSMLIGGGLIAGSLLFARSRNVLSALIGAGLLYRGMTGHCHAYDALGMSTADEDRSAPRIQSGSPRTGLKQEV